MVRAIVVPRRFGEAFRFKLEHGVEPITSAAQANPTAPLLGGLGHDSGCRDYA
jgi:hypothetical protein